MLHLLTRQPDERIWTVVAKTPDTTEWQASLRKEMTLRAESSPHRLFRIVGRRMLPLYPHRLCSELEQKRWRWGGF